LLIHKKKVVLIPGQLSFYKAIPIMRILIVSATFAEIKPLATTLKVNIVNTNNLYTTNYSGHEITLLITGVGMVATAFHMGGINREDFDVAINVGIAGSFTKDLQPGQLVNVTTDCFSEMGADYGEKFIPLYNMDFAKDFAEPFMTKGGILQNPTQTPNTIINELQKVKGITVNTVNGQAERIEKVVEMFSPEVESMEGAAFLFGCLKKGIPCFQLRTISNYIEPRNLNNWNIPHAIGILNKRLIEIIDAFS
jgi:futalosine hydrolase